MAGLLDFSQYDDPEQAARLAFAASLLESGGPQRFPSSVGQGIGRAVMMGRNTAQLAGEAQRRNALVGMQMQEMLAQAQQRQAMTAELERKARAQAELQARIGSLYPNDPRAALAAQVDPQEFAKSVFSQPKEPSPTELAKLIAERDKLPPGHPMRDVFDQAIKKHTEFAPPVSVSVGLQAPYAGTDAQGNPIVLQPPNKPGAQPQILNDPRTNQPIRPPASTKPPTDVGAMKQITGVRNLRSAVTEYVTALKKWGTLDVLSPSARADMGTKYNNMMLQAKEAYNLGVLNGPDFQILQSVVTDPRTLTGLITPNDALAKQATELARIMGTVEANVKEVHQRGQNQPPSADDDPLGIRQ